MTGSGASPEFITPAVDDRTFRGYGFRIRSEEHTSELQSRSDLVCRLLLEKKKKTTELQPRSNLGFRHQVKKKKQRTRENTKCSTIRCNYRVNSNQCKEWMKWYNTRTARLQ